MFEELMKAIETDPAKPATPAAPKEDAPITVTASKESTPPAPEVTPFGDTPKVVNQQAATLRAIYSAKLANIEADKEAETAGDKTAAGWNRAEQAIRGAGAALKEVRGAAVGVAETDLSGLNTQMNNLATDAERLRSVL